MGECIRIEREGDLAFVVIDNPPVNATSTAVRAELLAAVAQVADARAAVLICEGKTFIAGGDMSEFDAPAQEPHLPDVVQAIEDSPTPFIAAMHGTVLGGGFEIAMGCAWRIAAKGTKFGLPEVNVGLIPGAGGTQRTPRLLGMDLAVTMAAEGKIVSADAMLAAGGIDRIADDDLRAVARAFAADLPARPAPVSQRTAAPLDDPDARRAAVAKKARGQASPLLNFDALQWALKPFPEGQPMERTVHLELRNSAESRALRHAFFAQRQVSKPAAITGGTPRSIGAAAVVGGGLMGAGIATAMVNAGLPVTIIERDAEAAEAARARVHGNLDAALKRGLMDAATCDKRKSLLAVSADYADAASADLAVEAVFEDVSVKQEVFARLSAVMDRDAILATNTSYLDPRAIFEGIENPARCLGLHFFSPAHIMKLLEVVRTPDTSADTLATGFALAGRLRKIAVLSGICEGFIGNRILAAYRRAAEYLLADGALPDQVDAAMRGFGFAMGPFEVQDMAGLQIAWANRKAAADRRDPDLRYVTIADTLCEAERFGQRSGAGWYDYPDGPKSKTPSGWVKDQIIAYSDAQSIKRRSFTAEEIAERLVAVMANEGARIIEEGIAEDDAAVDMVKLHGYGFPRWRGGPMHYATQAGWDRIAATMGQIAKDSPGSWRMAERLKPKT